VLAGLGPPGSYVNGIFVPPLSSVVQRFDDEAAVESFVRDKNYNTAGLRNGTRIFAAIIIKSARPGLEYSIRMNSSEVPATSGDPVDTLALNTDLSDVSKYLESKIVTTGPPFANNNKASAVEKAPRPGFLSLQLMLDRWAIATPATSAPDMNALLSSLFYVLATQTASVSEISAYSSWIFSQSNATLAALLADVGSWMLPSESLAPQTVDFAPFPTPKLNVNTFSDTMISVFNIVYILAVLLPVATNIKAIVREREEKLREAMLMVGLSDAAIFLSWMFTYTIIYAVIAIFVMLFSLSTLFQFSNPGYSEC
jgi:hypothetical protein